VIAGAVIADGTAAKRWVAANPYSAGPFGFDTETEGINPKLQPAAGDAGAIVCFTVASRTDGATFFWATPDVLSVLGPWWSQAPVVGHNLYGFDAHLCRRAGYPLRNIRMDTLRAHKLLDTDPDAEHGLKPLMQRYLGLEPVGAFEELFTRRKCLESVAESELKTTWRKVGENPRCPTLVGGPHSRFGEVRELVPLSRIRTEHPALLADLYRYACLDAIATLRLWELFSERMSSCVWGTSG
jgi:hypothetical protein